MATNWVSDNFDLLLEDGSNILTEDEDFNICLFEFNTTAWTVETDVGDG